MDLSLFRYGAFFIPLFRYVAFVISLWRLRYFVIAPLLWRHEITQRRNGRFQPPHPNSICDLHTFDLTSESAGNFLRNKCLFESAASFLRNNMFICLQLQSSDAFIVLVPVKHKIATAFITKTSIIHSFGLITLQNKIIKHDNSIKKQI